MSNPFAFCWPDEVFREQFIHHMVTETSGRTNHPAKDFLRWLLYRFRVAKYRKHVRGPFEGHRWVWHWNAEAREKTGLSEKQLRTAREFLVQRGLIVVAYEYDMERNKLHYRPSLALFRAAHIVCLLRNELALRAGYDEYSLDEWAGMSDVILSHHYAEVSAALSAFANSTNRGRATALDRTMGRLAARVADDADAVHAAN